MLFALKEKDQGILASQGWITEEARPCDQTVLPNTGKTASS